VAKTSFLQARGVPFTLTAIGGKGKPPNQWRNQPGRRALVEENS